MNRRGFLKTCLGGVAVCVGGAVVPAVAKEHRGLVTEVDFSGWDHFHEVLFYGDTTMAPETFDGLAVRYNMA